MGQRMNGPAAREPPAPAHASESSHHSLEWEYEYDEHATEAIYFTLDLTTHVPDALVQKPDLFEDNPLPSAPVYNVEELLREDRSTDGGRLQVVDLATEHPLVKLDDGLYTCAWSTDLGTQFHISEAGVTATPRRSGTILDIVSTSQTRLIGKPVQLISPKGTRELVTPQANASDGIFTHEASGSDGESDARSDHAGLQAGPGQQLRIPRDYCKDPNADTQASFLERLSEIKLQKGEKDVVPIYSVRVYDPPANSDELRREALAADAEKAKQARDNQLIASGQRPRKRRRKLTHAEKGMEPQTDGLAGRQSRESTRARLGLQQEVSTDGQREHLTNESMDA